MLVPSKFTRLEESTIFKMRCILDDRGDRENVLDIYFRTKDCFIDASEFLHALDILFALGYVKIQNDSGMIEYA